MYAKLGALALISYMFFLVLMGVMGWGNHSPVEDEYGGSCISGRFKDDC